eukprot:TRINITY_DN9470_c0_g1_i2.p1 TRINITY_DN9470_c0_g1~~TRINITY_DN9470_c0_g1_i2.p1  ORF type:complete len:389 (+),score=1.11 TRINITY_DN9470_c0_g1_i2:51-1217(+)
MDQAGRNLYDILGVSKSATIAQISKAYRILAVKCHPDRHRDDPLANEKFKAINNAYKILSDEGSRANYDHNGTTHPGQEFRQAYNPHAVRGQDIIAHMNVTLAELYNGAIKPLKIQKKAICNQCEGQGAPRKKRNRACSLCKGSGVFMPSKPMAFGLQFENADPEECKPCKGTGYVVEELDSCEKCHGFRVSNEEKIIEVTVSPGAKTGTRIKLKGEGDQAPGGSPGDLVVILEEQPHPVFKRQHNDLIVEHELSLIEALTGFQFVINHLDDRLLLIRSNQIVSPGDSKLILNEGMPHGTQYQSRGDLIIQFRIKFPEQHELSQQVRDYLKVLLPSPPRSFDFSDVPGLQHVQLFDNPPSNSDPSEQNNNNTPFDPFGIYNNDTHMNL